MEILKEKSAKMKKENIESVKLGIIGAGVQGKLLLHLLILIAGKVSFKSLKI